MEGLWNHRKTQKTKETVPGIILANCVLRDVVGQPEQGGDRIGANRAMPKG